MAAYFRNTAWKDDSDLEDDLKRYTSQGLKRREILNFMQRDFAQYSWSIRTLDRRLRHFGIFCMDSSVSVEQVKEAVEMELDGPGKLLGIRAMQKKVRMEHGLNVPRDLVNEVMYDLDPEGLAMRAPGAKKRKVKGHFISKGPNWVHSLDGHDKLMGYQNSTFPLAIYGCIDTASRKLLWLRIWPTNSDPLVIGRWYLDYLYETRLIASHLRVDKGSETTLISTMHAFLRRNHPDDIIEPNDTVIYGPSTSNQIERWWKELHERLEKYFKHHLVWLKENHFYDPENEIDRLLLAYIFIPIMERELTIFKDTIWNIHRIRVQKDAVLPNGVPDHIYNFPEQYNLEECGWPVTEEQLQEVALQSGVLGVKDDYLEQAFRNRCEQLIPNPKDIDSKECANAYVHLKTNFH